MRETLATLTPAERRIAELILDRPHAAMSWSITEMSRFADVSDPSVIRFCRRMGCNGFPALKLELAQALARAQVAPNRPINFDGDPTAGMINDILAKSEQALREAHSDLAATAVGEAAKAMVEARRIDIYGFGFSGLLAQEAQYRMASLGLPATAYYDPIIQATTAPLLDNRDLIIGLSFSGLTQYLCENVALAKNSGARILTISPAGSPLASLAHINLALNAYRRSENFLVSPTARISFHMILNVLCAVVATELQMRKQQT